MITRIPCLKNGSRKENGCIHPYRKRDGKYGGYISLFNPETGSGNIDDAQNYFQLCIKAGNSRILGLCNY